MLVLKLAVVELLEVTIGALILFLIIKKEFHLEVLPQLFHLGEQNFSYLPESKLLARLAPPKLVLPCWVSWIQTLCSNSLGYSLATLVVLGHSNNTMYLVHHLVL